MDNNNLRKEWGLRELELCKKTAIDPSVVEACDTVVDIYKCVSEINDQALTTLKKLLDQEILNPIVDDPEHWVECTKDEKCVGYRSVRKSSIFKDVYNDGTVEYTDVERIVCSTRGVHHHFGWAHRTAVELGFIPKLEMPYTPAKRPYVIKTEDYLRDTKNGDFDTVALLNVTDPYGVVTDINKFYTTDETGEFVEISKGQYYEWKKTALRISDDNGFYVSPSYNAEQNTMFKYADELKATQAEAVDHD